MLDNNQLSQLYRQTMCTWEDFLIRQMIMSSGSKIKRENTMCYGCNEFDDEDYEMMLEHAEKELEAHKSQRDQCITSISAYSERLGKINKEIDRCERIIEVSKAKLADD